MANLGEPAGMTIDALFNELLRIKPRGWSVTRAKRSLSVRPPDRKRCKFKLSFFSDGQLSVGRFDHALNHWTGFEHIDPSFLNAGAVFAHLQQRVEGERESRAAA